MKKILNTLESDKNTTQKNKLWAWYNVLLVMWGATAILNTVIQFFLTVTFEQRQQIDEEERHMDTYIRIVQAEKRALQRTWRERVPEVKEL